MEYTNHILYKYSPKFLFLYKLFLHACNMHQKYLPYLDDSKNLLVLVMTFYYNFFKHQCINTDKHFFTTSQQNKFDFMVWKFVCGSKSQVLLQNKHLYTTKLSLTFVYSTQNHSLCIWSQTFCIFLISCFYLHWVSWILSPRSLTKLNKKLDINLTLSTNFNLRDMVFVISSTFLAVFSKLFFYWHWKGYVFSRKQINCL